MPYHLRIVLLDRSSPNASRQRLRSVAPCTPHPTATGLPGPLDLLIAAAPSFHPRQFWDNLSDALTTRLGEHWESLEEPEVHEPRAEWFEPSTTTSAKFTPQATLDYRFGPITVDWIDHPGLHPVFGVARDMKGSTSALAASTSTSSTAQPTALFVPSSTQPAYQLGTTDFGYGSIHLYRDAVTAEKDAGVLRRSAVGERGRSSDAEESEMRGDGTVVAVLAIPSYMTASDFLAFIEKAVEAIDTVRILRDAMPNRSIGLVKFRESGHAKAFARDCDGRPFSHLQDREICHVVHVESVLVKPSLVPPFTFPALLSQDHITASAEELPTCPVCLERMDSSATGLMIIPCSHTFHCTCLSKWGDSRCPVCRYSQTRLRTLSPSASAGDGGQPTSECAACGSDANLWICLICGHVGCGRYQGGHAYRHFEDTAHTYALELGSQRVWDYVGDGYVHRLVQTKNNEMIELPALSSAVFDSSGALEALHGASSGTVGSFREASAYQAKIEAISEEFGSLVASQLDSQRAFYDKELRLLNEDLEVARSALSDQEVLRTDLMREKHEMRQMMSRVNAENERLGEVEREVIPELEKDKSRLEKKADKALELAKRFEKDLNLEKVMGQGMRQKLTKFESEKVEADERTSALETKVKDLEEQIRDLMFFLDAQTKIRGEGGEELQGGSVSVPQPSPAKTPRRKKK